MNSPILLHLNSYRNARIAGERPPRFRERTLGTWWSGMPPRIGGIDAPAVGESLKASQGPDQRSPVGGRRGFVGVPRSTEPRGAFVAAKDCQGRARCRQP